MQGRKSNVCVCGTLKKTALWGEAQPGYVRFWTRNDASGGRAVLCMQARSQNGRRSQGTFPWIDPTKKKGNQEHNNGRGKDIYGGK